MWFCLTDREETSVAKFTAINLKRYRGLQTLKQYLLLLQNSMYNLLYKKYQNLIPYVNERRVIRFYQGLVLYKANMYNYIQIIS